MSNNNDPFSYSSCIVIVPGNNKNCYPSKGPELKEIATFLSPETSSLLFDGNILSKMCVNTNCVYQDITEKLNSSWILWKDTRHPCGGFRVFYSTVENSFYDCQINSFHSGEKTWNRRSRIPKAQQMPRG